jgi:hypothetical protein
VWRRSVFYLLPLAAIAGCGNSRTPVPNPLAPAPAKGFRAIALPAAGVSVNAPRTWTVTSGRGPLMEVISSGAAVIAVWRYPRTSAPPTGTAAVDQAEQTLIQRARARDPALAVISSKVLRAEPRPTIQLEALEHIAGQLRTVRSTHIFLPKAELVLDEYAPPQVFAAVDRAVFAPVARSLVATTAV